jgi:hypothetical protein
MPWWAWLVLGMMLLAGEMVTPGGFYLLFFGAGALAVGLLGLLGSPGPVWLQWLLFSVLSVGALLIVRPRLLGRLRSGAPALEDNLVGEMAIAREPIAAGALGRGELRGTYFTLRNAGAEALAAGERSRVERVDGLILCVRKEP